jgi:hypothetical protein
VFAIKAVDEASGVMQKVSASVGLIGMELQQLGPGFAQVGQVMQGFAVAGGIGAAIVGVGELVQGLQASVQVASDSQSAWAMLQQSLHLTGDAWAAQQPQIQNFVSGLEKVTTVSQTAAVGGLQLLATYGMSATQAEEAMGVAADLSAAKHLDLNTAVNLVGKAFDGVTTTLSRYGIIIQTTAKANADLKQGTMDLTDAIQKAGPQALEPFQTELDAAGIKLETASGKMESASTIATELVKAYKDGTLTTAQFNEINQALGVTFDWSKARASDYQDILKQLNTQFGGSAQAQLDTYAGKTQQLANEWQDIQVQLGTLLLPILKDLVDWLDTTLPKIESWVNALIMDPSVQAAWGTLLDVFHKFQASGDLQKVIDFVTEVAKGAIEVTLDLVIAGMDLLTAVIDDLNKIQALLVSAGIIPPPTVTQPTGPGLSHAGPAEMQPEPTPPTVFSPTGPNQQWVINRPAIQAPFKTAMDNIGQAIMTPLQKAGQDIENWWNSLWKKTAADTTSGTAEVVGAETGGLGPMATSTLDIGNKVSTNLGTNLWSKISTATQTGLTAIGTALGNVGSKISSGLTTTWTQVSTGAQTGLTAVTTAVTTAGAGVQSAWSGAMNALQALNPWSTIQGTFSAGISAVGAAVAGGASEISSAWSGVMSDLISAAASAVGAIESFFAGLAATVSGEVQGLYNTLVGHSIWTDMLDIMLSQTEDSLSKVTASFKDAGATIPGLIPVMNGLQLNAGGSMASPPAAPAAPGNSLGLPLRNTTILQVDGQTLARLIEVKRVRQRNLHM